MSKFATIVRTDHTTEVIDLEAGEGELRQLQKAVDGLVQPLDLQENITMWVNEEGLLRDLPLNLMPTMLFKEMFDQTTPILGDVIFTGGTDEEGNTEELPLEAQMRLKEIVQAFHEQYSVEA